MKKDQLCDASSGMKKDQLYDGSSSMKKDYLWDDTSIMKKDWLCRGSYDEKNQEIEPMMMPSDDPDWVMMTQI